MNNRRSRTRPTFEERYRALENALQQKNYTSELPRSEIIDTSDQSHSPGTSGDQSFVFNSSQRSSNGSYGNILTKDREIAKLKALIFQKDNEFIALTSSHKNTLSQIEERMERERKVWNEHKDLLLADERAKFDEEKNRLLKDLQYQLNFQRERCQNLEEKLYEAQKQSNEVKFLLKENDRERINAIYNTKEQCRKEYQEEITRLRNQFQLEKDTEFTRIQKNVRGLEETLNQISSGNIDITTRQQEVLLNLETAEKACVRFISDLIKKLLMAIDSPAHIYSTIPNISSFTYDQASILEHLPTRNILKSLQNTVDDIRKYIIEQRVQIETKTILLKNSQTSTNEPSSRIYDDKYQQSSPTRSLYSQQKTVAYQETQPFNRFQLSSRHSHTVDNLMQKLENNITSELDRLTKQRMTSTNSTHHVELSRRMKLEPNSGDDENQDIFLRNLQDRINDRRDDNRRSRDYQHYNNNDDLHPLTSMRSRNYLTTQ